MPDSPQDHPPVPPAPHRAPLRLGALVLTAGGGVAVAVAAFLPWFTVTADLPRLPGLPSSLTATVTGTGAVSMDAIGGADASSSVPVGAAWAGWTVIALAVAAVALAGTAAFAGAATARICGAVAAACGLGAAGVGVYALLVPVGRETVSAQGVTLDVQTTAAYGPYVVIVGAAAVLAGALVITLARRSAPVAVVSAPQAPYAHAPQPVPHAPLPQQVWARPAAPAEPVRAPSNPTAAPSYAEPEHPDAPHHDTAISPVSRRRPQPEWDRDWPTLVPAPPAPPAPPTPSQQETVVVKRPPRPVRVSPNPETRRIPRSDGAPHFDGPTQPL
ncbi:hypothetical protein [Tsukamurella sp. 1534]|uniref:hypothetical protein n=1 Tax=Tsukamurella sp. 1534 TaxID=1151061 RepID=UPI0002F7C3A9|nr:hypothetical protein [Tsukamurella sp. 1534]